jgi:hypothetical protein
MFRKTLAAVGVLLQQVLFGVPTSEKKIKITVRYL